MTSVEEFYAHALTKTTLGMTAHLPRLRALAEGLELVVEFGVRRAASSSALLLGASRVLSYDIVETADARLLERLAGGRWTYRIGDSKSADVPPCQLLFVDSLHTYAQVRAELTAHADKAQRYLVFHDSVKFGSVGERGGLGIRPAIDELMIRDPSWRIRAHYPDSCGLLVLEREASCP